MILGPGGMPWEEGNAYLARLAKAKKAAGTVDQYASVIRVYAEYCTEMQRDPAHMTFDSLEAYRQHRIDEGDLGAETWNASLAPLKGLYNRIRSGPGIVLRPITDEDWRDLRLSGDRVSMPRFVEPDDYVRFRLTGLQARDLRTGRLTVASYALRSPVRNALYADCLLTHGMRRAEAGYLTLLDLPRRREGYAWNSGSLSAKICKGSVSRPWREQRSWVRRLAIYQDTEWTTTVEQLQPTLRRLRKQGDLLVVTDVDDRFGTPRLVLEGPRRTRALGKLSREQRRRLVCTPEVAARMGSETGMGARGFTHVTAKEFIVPLAVFPGTRTAMLTPAAWGLTFREANARVKAAVRATDPLASAPGRVTPHMLRHTFATRFLDERLTEMAKEDREFAEAYANGDFARLRKRFFNPLLDLQKLLGHASLDTTLRYLKYLTERQPAVHMPGDSWTESYLNDIPA
ncbi:hypothetical protein QOZ88_06330 [Blastococcus sp. BMG 814]|uniref:Site-specific recombinase XerD n=1 Tax=Blastococcus carthaginiensis TaxID=3050034 RepID=A0ABT9I9J7_9ACTN|nr:hypothetical protein [Blastococcus carthaginiensis]MDP5182248.1 hypothetical protein [Blastococcus carthaginiensis]